MHALTERSERKIRKGDLEKGRKGEKTFVSERGRPRRGDLETLSLNSGHLFSPVSPSPIRNKKISPNLPFSNSPFRFWHSPFLKI